MTQNPNWPLIDVAVSFDTGPANSIVAMDWCSMKNRTLGQIATNRGRQYELDQVQTGTWMGSLENTDAALDPANASSPFYPQVLPYRAFRHRAQYPATVNLLTADQATGWYNTYGAAGSPGDPGVNAFPPNVVPNAILLANSDAYRQYDAPLTTNCYSFVIDSTKITAPFDALTVGGASLVQGATMSAQANITAGSASTITARLRLDWYSATGTLISSTNGTTVSIPTFSTVVSVSGTAPTGAAGVRVVVDVRTATAGTPVLFVANLQLEQAASPSSYVIPGTWYSLFTGYVERWPQSWSMSGQFGTSDLTVVDAFGYLSQRKLLSSAYHEVLNLNPDWFYPLDEATGASTFTDMTANRPPLPILVGLGATASMCVSGGTLQDTGGGYLPTGIGGPVVTFTNPWNGIVGTALNMAATRTTLWNPYGVAWTRIVAFRVATMPGSTGSYLWFAYDNPTNNNAIAIKLMSDGSILAEMENYGTVTPFTVAPAGSVTAGGWHLVGLASSADSRTVTTYFDGATPTATAVGAFIVPAVGLPYDGYGTDIATVDAFGGFTGDMAMLAEFPTVLTSAQWSSLYSTFRYGGSGLGVASSTTRYSDILRWADWASPSAIDSYTTGETVAYGPASELTATAADNGTDAVSALQTVVDTDAGTHYVDTTGTVTFRARRARYNQGTPAVIFGEHTTSGEIPYVDAKTGYDNTRIANDISVVQTQTSVTQRSVDTTSANLYGDVQLQRTVNTLSATEMTDAANYLRLRNSQPVQRIEGIKVNVGANPTSTVWAAMLGLDLGSRVRVMRRPPLGAAAIQVDGFVEQINWTIDDKANAAVDLQISVNNAQTYWQLDSSTFSVLGSTTIVGY